jgi:hypothetical protein
MEIFSILKIYDEYNVKHYPLDELLLDPHTVASNQSGGTTAPIDGLSAILISGQIF